MHTPRTRHTHATHTPCTHHARTMHAPCTHHAHAMHTPCTRHAPCTRTRHAHAMHTPCTRHAHAMHMPCAFGAPLQPSSAYTLRKVHACMVHTHPVRTTRALHCGAGWGHTDHFPMPSEMGGGGAVSGRAALLGGGGSAAREGRELQGDGSPLVRGDTIAASGRVGRSDSTLSLDRFEQRAVRGLSRVGPGTGLSLTLVV